MYQKKIPPEQLCPFEYALSIFNGKWDTRILCLLAHNDSLRFGQLKIKLKDISDTSLSNVLKKFITNDIVERIAYNEIPPHVEYHLTTRGQEIVPIFQELCMWAMKGENISTNIKITSCEECKYGITEK